MTTLRGTRGPLVAMLVLVAAACTTPAANAPADLQPQDFAQGLTIEAPDGHPFVSVTVPEDVFTGTAWPDLRDVRIFNAAAEPVPFARIAAAAVPGSTRRLPLQSFRLRSENPGAVPQIEFDARTGGMELRVRPGVTTEAGAEYLLALADTDLTGPIERLYLDWQDEPRNWQQRVTVSVSADLQNWTTVAAGQPLMDLRTEDGGRLKHAEITVHRAMRQLGRYWRVTFAPGFSPTLTRVEGETTGDLTPPRGIRLPASSESLPDGSLLYRLARPEPVLRLRVTPLDVNSVLPIQIDGRASETAAWQSLGRTVAFRLNVDGGEQFSDAFPLGGRVLASVRIRPLGTTWGAMVPAVEIERSALTLVVNARGAGPFLLAWGARAATDTAVDLATLVPTLRTNVPVSEQFPEARVGARQTLGGPSRLSAESPAERAARWQTALVWIALIGGVGVLAWLAIGLLRETRR